jgi:hypothetical protein
MMTRSRESEHIQGNAVPRNETNCKQSLPHRTITRVSLKRYLTTSLYAAALRV